MRLRGAPDKVLIYDAIAYGIRKDIVLVKSVRLLHV